jgi:cell cycle sensor histidine kinase DivJ
VQFFNPICDYIDTLVHPSVRRDALAAARHRAFIGPRLIGSAVLLAAFPLYLAMRGVPSALEIVVFAWLVAPILTAYFLSRTGRYERAHILSSLVLTALATTVAAKTGGINSFAAIWLVIIPLEAALSASRRVLAAGSVLALFAAGLLILGGAKDLPPAPVQHGEGALAALAIASAAVYATSLALGAESLARTGAALLDAEKNRYRLLAGNMADVITRHGRHGSVLFASPAAEALFGAKVEDLLGHGLFDRVHVADRPAFLAGLSDAREGQSVEFRVRRDGVNSVAGRFIWIEMRCRPIDEALDRCATPHSREVVAIMRAIVERKAQEHALEEARNVTKPPNAAEGRFLAIMSHELRTPLNAIIGFSEMLMREADLPLDAARRREYTALINESGTHLLSVVDGVLDMAKLDTGDFKIRPEPCSIAPVVGVCGDLLALKAREAGLELVIDVPRDLPEIVADKCALKQILLNLLSNAIKFTDRDGEVRIAAALEGAAVAITVADNGIGIGEADLPRIGKPFFQASGSRDRRRDGTGLGLSIVKGLVALHGGDVTIRSQVGEGTRVTVRLPLDCEGATHLADQAIRIAPPASMETSAGFASSVTTLVRKSA